MVDERPLPVHLRPAGPATVRDAIRGVQGVYLTLSASAVLTVSTSLYGRFELQDTLLAWPVRYLQLMAALGVALGVSFFLLAVFRVLKHLPATEVDIEPGRFEVRRMMGLVPLRAREIELANEMLDVSAGRHHVGVHGPKGALLRRVGVRHDDVWLLADAVKDRNRVVLGNRAR